jgi:hypothetical protein
MCGERYIYYEAPHYEMSDIKLLVMVLDSVFCNEVGVRVEFAIILSFLDLFISVSQLQVCTISNNGVIVNDEFEKF